MSLQAHLFDLNVAMRVLYLHTVQTLKTKPYFHRVMVFVSLEVALPSTVGWISTVSRRSTF